jgi:thymidine phosphorylase
MALCSSALINSGLAKNENEANAKLESVLRSGKALEVFAKMTTALGGPADFCEKYDSYLQKANIIEPIFAQNPGIVESMNAIEIGMGVVGLGGGRIRPSDKIDHSVGLENIIGLGESVDKHRPIATIHAKDRDSFNEAKKRVLNAINIGDKKPTVKEIYEIIS